MNDIQKGNIGKQPITLIHFQSKKPDVSLKNIEESPKKKPSTLKKNYLKKTFYENILKKFFSKLEPPQ